MLLFFLLMVFTNMLFAATSIENQKSHLEDIFIWKMSDELKLTAQEEKKFAEIQKELNKKKSDINQQIQKIIESLEPKTSKKNASLLKKHRQLISQYNQLSLQELDDVNHLLKEERFAQYLQIKADLTQKIKLLLAGDKSAEKEQNKESLSKPSKPLPPPQVIIEKNE